MEFFNAAGVTRSTFSWVFSSAPSSPASTNKDNEEREKASMSLKTPSSSVPDKTTSSTGLTDQSSKDATPDYNDSTMGGICSVGSTGGCSKGKKKNKKKKQVGDLLSKSTSGAKAGGVKWGHVEQIFFSREISYSSVPNRGAYPLGLGEETGRTTSTIDELFVQQQTVLLERATSLSIPIPLEKSPKPPQSSPKTSNGNVSTPPSDVSNSPKRKGKKQPFVEVHTSTTNSSTITSVNASSGSNYPSSSSSAEFMTELLSSPSSYMSPLFETRQFDYKRGRNSMFTPMTEDKRILALMSNKPEWSKLTDTSKSYSQSPDHTEHLTDMIKEVKEIQHSREFSSNGCTCKPIKVDKLSVTKMKAELVVSGQYELKDVDNCSKAELMAKLKVVVNDCDLCTTNNCVCVQMGLQCSAQSQCGCLRAVNGIERHERRSRSNTADSNELEESTGVLCQVSAVQSISKTSSVEDDTSSSSRSSDSDSGIGNNSSNSSSSSGGTSIRKKVPCGNENGYELFDMAVVNEYRRCMLASVPYRSGSE